MRSASRGSSVRVRASSRVSVDHPEVVEHYRKAHAIHTGSRASTEDLREAMLHYRALFAELLERPERETQEVR